VILGAVLGLALGSLIQQVRAPVYESRAIVTVTSASVRDASSLARAAQAISRVATTRGIIGDPLRNAGLDDVADDPRSFVNVEAAPDAPLVSITGTATDAETAQLTAQTVVDALAAVTTLGPYQVVMATAPLLPDGPTTPWWLLPAGGAGLAAGLSVILAATLPTRPEHARHRASHHRVAQKRET